MLIDLRAEGLNIYFLCPFLAGFCTIGSSFVSSKGIFGNYPFIKKIFFSLSEILSVIPFLIYLKIQRNSSYKSQMKNNRKNTSKKELINNKIEEIKNNVKIWKYIFLGFLDFLYFILFYLGKDLFNNKFTFYFMSSNILFLIILQKLLLKIRIHRHQTASFIIFFILDIVYIIIILLDSKLKYDIKEIIFIFVSNFFFSFEITYIKVLINDGLILLYKLCLMIGIFSLCFNIIAAIIIMAIDFYFDIENTNEFHIFNCKYYLDDINTNILKEIIIIIIFVLLSCFYNVLKFLTIKNLSANHVLITSVMFAIYNSILIKIQKIEITQLTSIFSFVIYIIFFFVLFIFIEIIQLNFCGINKDITFKIGLRNDVDRYMQSFSSNEDEYKNINDKDKVNNNTYLNNDEKEEKKSTEMKERNMSIDSSDLESFEDA